MPAFTMEQLRKMFENAPGSARVSAVQAAKLAVAAQLTAVSRFIDIARTSQGQPTEAEYTLLGRLNELDHVLKDLEFAITTRLATEEAACLKRLSALLQTPPVSPPLAHVCVGCGDRSGPDFMRPGRPLWRVIGRVISGTEAPAGLCPDCQERSTTTSLFELVDPAA